MTKIMIDRDLLERIGELMHIIAHRQDDYGVEEECLGSLLKKVLAQPTQQGEVVEVVGWRRLDRTYELTAYPSVCAIWHGVGYPVQALYAKPAASVPAGCKVVPVELLEQIAVELEHDNNRYFLGRELRAMLTSAEGGE